jgi:hypothetical protein
MNTAKLTTYASALPDAQWEEIKLRSAGMHNRKWDKRESVKAARCLVLAKFCAARGYSKIFAMAIVR